MSTIQRILTSKNKSEMLLIRLQTPRGGLIYYIEVFSKQHTPIKKERKKEISIEK